MNILHLKYADEIARARSISQAAENLYMGQPNLSRALKELETSLGITIFKRTPKGMTPTPQGEAFLQHARRILSQIDEMEALYKNQQHDKQAFSISVPRASYICSAFTAFAQELNSSSRVEVYYKETNAMRAISNILQADYRMGIIRYQKQFESYFSTTLYEKDLSAETLYDFSYHVAMSKKHPLAEKKDLTLADLRDFMEIAHADPFVPSLPSPDAKKAELSDLINKRIFVFERASQLELLSNVPTTFMRVSPIPQTLQDQYNLVVKPCISDKRRYKDVLIYRNGYHFTDLDNLFLHKLKMLIKTFE